MSLCYPVDAAATVTIVVPDLKNPLMHPLDIHWIHWVLSVGSVALVTGASLAGMLALSIHPSRLVRILPNLVSVAAGALLGTAFGHLLPESVKRVGSGRTLSALLAASFATFFLLERAVGLYLTRTGVETHEHSFHEHSHSDPQHDQPRQRHPAIAGLLVGAGIHSFIDGIAIATCYINGTRLGLVTTFAILLHEAPHIGDVSILIHLGTSIKRSVVLNLMVGSTSTIGALFVLFMGDRSAAWTKVLLPFTTANFIYVGSVGLMPELQRERGIGPSIMQAGFLVLGCLLMLVVSNFVSD